MQAIWQVVAAEEEVVEVVEVVEVEEVEEVEVEVACPSP